MRTSARAGGVPRPARLLLIVDSRIWASAAVAEGVIRAARERADVEVVGALDAALRPPPRLGLLPAVVERIARRAFDRDQPTLLERDSLRSVRAVCRRHRVPLWRPPDRDVNGEAAQAWLAALRPDLALSLLCGQILQPRTLARFRAAANWHPGRLPAYRGSHTTSWEVYRGEPEGGFAYHLLTEGIDEGPVLVEGSVPIPPAGRAGAVERAKARAAAARAGEALDALVSGRPGMPQEGHARSFSRAHARPLTHVGNPSALDLSELDRRLRAFGLLELRLPEGVRKVTAVRPRRRAGRRGGRSFTTADGVLVEATRFGYLPLSLHRVLELRRSNPRARLAHSALFGLARLNRLRLRRTTFVAITGSAGKTTAKNLLAAILASRGPIHATEGTANRGRPLAEQVLGARRRHAACVLEVGFPGPDVVAQALGIVRPQVAVVTSVGMDHYASYRGPDAAAAAKGRLVAALPRDGIAVLNADDPRVRAMASLTSARVVLYGLAEEADFRAERVQADFPACLGFELVWQGRRHEVRTRLVGPVWTTAVLAALATGVTLGVPIEQALVAVAEVEPEPHRLAVRSLHNGVTFVHDDFKGSSWTLPHALEALGSYPGRRIAVIGRLADEALPDRRRWVRYAEEARRHADLVLLVGVGAHHGLRARSGEDDGALAAFATTREAHEHLAGLLRPGDVVLLKATGGSHTERLALAHERPVECWREDCGRAGRCEDCALLEQPSSGRGRIRGRATVPPSAPAAGAAGASR